MPTAGAVVGLFGLYMFDRLGDSTDNFRGACLAARGQKVVRTVATGLPNVAARTGLFEFL